MQLAAIIPKIISDKSNIIAINLVIQNNWQNIITSQLIYFIKFNNALISVINNKRTLNVVVDVISSAIILAKNQQNTIKSSIRLLTGIENINIKYHQVLNFNTINNKDWK